MTRIITPLKDAETMASWFVNNFSDFNSLKENSAQYTTFGGKTRMNLLGRKNKSDYSLRVFYRRTLNRRNEDLVIDNYLDDDLLALFENYLRFNGGVTYDETLSLSEKLNRLTNKEYLFFLNDYLIKKRFNVRALDDFLANTTEIMRTKVRQAPSKDFEKKFEFLGRPLDVNSITPHSYFWPKAEESKVAETPISKVEKQGGISEREKLELELLQRQRDVAQMEVEIIQKRLSLMK